MAGSLQTPCDTNLAGVGASGGAKYPRLTLVTTILASSLAFVDGSVVGVALPAIGHDLKGAASDLQWIVNAYLLPLSALLLMGGGAGDRFGRKKLLIGGTALFALASVLCAFAPTLALLLAGRALQGVGAAMLMPNSLAILGTAFDGEEKGRAIGTWAAAGAIAGAIGPLIGGWLVDTLGWRTIFFINLPIALGAIGMAWAYVEETSDEERPALDWLGAGLATLALFGITWGLTIQSLGRQHGTPDPIGTWALAGGAALLLLFVLAEWRRGERAMMPVTLFASKSFVGLTLLTLLLYGALGGLLVLLPYLLIQGAGYSAFGAGAALLPFPLVIGLASRAMGRLAARIGPRLPLSIGPAIVAGGFLLASRISADSNYWTGVLPAILVISLGMAGGVAPLTTAVLSSVDRQHTGTASGFNSAVARTGGMIATALLGAALSASGAALVASFHEAALAAAAASLAAGASALLLLSGPAARPSLEAGTG